MDMQRVTIIPELLQRIGEKHAQGILWSLIFARNNEQQGNTQQVNKATLVIEKIRDHSRELVDEAELVSEELVNVSMLWIDVWQEGLDSKRISLFFITIDCNISFVVKRPINKLI